VASSSAEHGAPSAPLRIAILISGRGSNMQAIARACAEQRISGKVVSVIADREEAGGLEVARQLGIETAMVPWRAFAERSAFERELHKVLAAGSPDIVALAGFMRILTPQFVLSWEGRMLNIHPSLLPLHTGLDTHRRVLAAGDAAHGASVHFVTAELDGGPVVLQARLVVHPGESVEALSARVQAAEHIIYPRALGWIADGRLAWRDGGPLLDDRPLGSPIVEEFD
jgi:phosphoribosylglycinamide formyltransferase 1